MCGITIKEHTRRPILRLFSCRNFSLEAFSYTPSQEQGSYPNLTLSSSGLSVFEQIQIALFYFCRFLSGLTHCVSFH